ncbi:pyridoxine/pyridoxamine 5'-phosphate oxidase [Streptomyces cucumeris]|uniref:pyridoxine/pyridoxamine 5'-phosphate oxidase n=1 Tax=Streptomyces cucumeris TaxID=2962890 RepID=UPI003D731FB3
MSGAEKRRPGAPGAGTAGESGLPEEAGVPEEPGETDASFRELLGGLRVRHGGELPVFTPERAPDTPLPLFRRWLREAAASGEPAPHTMVLATAGADGRPSQRVVMLRGADARGWHFGTHRTSRKGRELAERPYASLAFHWPHTGRQVRIGGRVQEAGAEESAADLRGRSPAALAAALAGAGRQSEVLGAREELARAFEAAYERAEREPDAPAPSWTLYALEPDEVEFYQEEARRRHVRLRYRRAPEASGGWRRELLWP